MCWWSQPFSRKFNLDCLWPSAAANWSLPVIKLPLHNAVGSLFFFFFFYRTATWWFLVSPIKVLPGWTLHAQARKTEESGCNNISVEHICERWSEYTSSMSPTFCKMVPCSCWQLSGCQQNDWICFETGCHLPHKICSSWCQSKR